MAGPSLRKCVADLMIEDVYTVETSASVADVIQMMAKKNIGAVIVVNAIKDPIGIFTERDLLKRVAAPGLDSSKTTMAEVMTPKFVCVQTTDDIEELPEIMVHGNFRHLPVVDGSKLVGILSLRDVAKYLAGLY